MHYSISLLSHPCINLIASSGNLPTSSFSAHAPKRTIEMHSHPTSIVHVHKLYLT